MKGTKAQKGITLIALIIIIVVLLILAAVAISSITNDGILGYAQNAANTYNQAVANEQTMLQNYVDKLEELLPSGSSGSGTGVTTVTPKVGQYVEYDVSYDDMYNSTSSATKTFGKTDGWRYLGTETDEEGKIKHHLLISTGVPMILNYNYSETTNSAQWWDTAQTNINAKMTEGLKKNLSSIPYAKVSAGTTSTSNNNTMIGLFGENTRTTVGDYFKVTGKSYSNSITVRTLTLAELNRAVNSAMENVDGYAERNLDTTKAGFKNIPEGNPAYGLFDLSDIGLSNNYYYWLASLYASDTNYVHNVCFTFSDVNYSSCRGGCDYGVRPVVVLPSSIQFTDSDNNTILEIK